MASRSWVSRLRSRTLATLSLLLTSAALEPQLFAQAPGAPPRCPSDQIGSCRASLVTESTFGLVVNGQGAIDERPSVSATLGAVHAIAPRFGLGALLTAGLVDNGVYIGVGPRLRYDITPTIAVDLSPKYLLWRDGHPGSQSIIEAGLMFSNRVGLSLQLVSSDDWQPAPISLGVRLGSKPGRYGLLVAGIGAAAAGVVALLVCCGG